MYRQLKSELMILRRRCKSVVMLVLAITVLVLLLQQLTSEKYEDDVVLPEKRNVKSSCSTLRTFPPTSRREQLARVVGIRQLFNDLVEGRRSTSDYFGTLDEELLCLKRSGWLAEQVTRLQRVKASCGGKISRSSNLTFHQLRGSTEYLVAMCKHPKVASTTLANHFSELAGEFDPGVTKTDLLKNTLNPDDYNVDTDLDMYLFFTAVRHPFHRLVSSYENRVLYNRYSFGEVKSDILELRSKTVDEIKKKYLNGVEILKSGEKETWELKKADEKLASQYPTFREFAIYAGIQQLNINAISSKPRINKHWTRYVDSCSACKHNFDLIFKLESFDEDMDALRSMMKLPDIFQKMNDRVVSETRAIRKVQVLDGKIAIMNQSNSTTSYTDYWQQLRRDEIDIVYTGYSDDFKMFGYEMDI